jgi:hypothetical protein
MEYVIYKKYYYVFGTDQTTVENTITPGLPRVVDFRAAVTMLLL